MKNQTKFEDFLANLKPSNRTLSFYVDWDKCLKNRDDISISLNHLNFLLGKSGGELKKGIQKLFDTYPKAFECLNIVLAVRDEKDILLDSESKEVTLNSYFKNVNKIYEFICQSGLQAIFADKKINNLNDFVFGVEVGLDTNARKNRSGISMENLVEQMFTNTKLNFNKQVSIKEFANLYKNFGEDIKRFDFVVFSQKIYFIECNFYTGGGSKLNETARAYQDLAIKFDNLPHYSFVWITDGQGWFSAKNKLQEAYKNVEIYNLSNLHIFIEKVKNDNAH